MASCSQIVSLQPYTGLMATEISSSQIAYADTGNDYWNDYIAPIRWGTEVFDWHHGHNTVDGKAATPFYNSVNDFFTLVRFISPIKDYYNTGSITEVVIGWEPFQVPDDDPAAILRLSHSTIEKFIASPDVDSLAAGVLIGLVMRMCMIRRTLSSCIPFGSTRKIGNDVPPQYSRVIHTCFHPTMQPIYTELSAPHRKNLIFPMETTGQKTTAAKRQRATLANRHKNKMWPSLRHER